MNKKTYILALLVVFFIIAPVASANWFTDLFSKKSNLGATTFTSSQVGQTPVSGYYLKTNGTVSTWAAVSATGSGGSGTVGTSTPLAAGQIDFSTAWNTIGNDSNFVWDNTNKYLGVGTSTPYSMLSVAGQIVGQNFVATSTTATSTFASGVSIGTIGSRAPLDVYSTATLNPNPVLWLGSSDSVNNGIKFGAGGSVITGGNSTIQIFYSGSSGLLVNSTGLQSTGGTLQLGGAVNALVRGGGASGGKLTISTNADEIVLSPANGLVGIGTTTPYAPLSVVGAGGVVAGKFTATSSVASSFLFASSTALSATTICLSTDCKTVWPAGGGGSGGLVVADTPTPVAGGIPIFNSTATSTATATSSLFISTASFVGIATTVPRALLDVASTGTANPNTVLYLGSNDTVNNRIAFGAGGTSIAGGNSTVSAYYSGSNGLTVNSTGLSSTGGTISLGNVASVVRGGAGQLTLSTNASHIILSPNSGFVGIGTTTPNTTLTVNGNTALENQGQLRLYQLRANGAFYASLSASTTPAMTANVNWTLPRVDGTSGQTLATNGSGNLYWTAVSASASSTLLADNNNWSGANTFTGLTTLGNASTTNFSATYASSTSLYVGNRNVLGTFDKSFGNIASTTKDLSLNTFNTATTTFILWNPSVAVGATAWYCKTTSGTVTAELGNGTASTTVIATTAGVSGASALTWSARGNVYVALKDSAASTANGISCTATYYNQ